MDYKRGDDEEPLDLNLARAIRDFNRNIPPERDLWPGIERQIAANPVWRRDWKRWFVPVSVAASVLMAATALLLVLQQDSTLLQRDVTVENSLRQIEREYQQARNPLIQAYFRNNQHLDEDTLNLVYRNMQIIEKARKEVELALLQNPEDQRLLDMLMQVRQKELDLLSQSYGPEDQSI